MKEYKGKIKKGCWEMEKTHGKETISQVITEPCFNYRGQIVFKSKTKCGREVDYIKSPCRLEVVTEYVE